MTGEPLFWYMGDTAGSGAIEEKGILFGERQGVLLKCMFCEKVRDS